MVRSEPSAKKPRRPRAERKFADILGEQRTLIRRATAAILVSRLVLVVIPLQLKFLLDQLVARRPLDALGFEISPVNTLILAVSIGVLVACVRGVADYVFIATAARCGHSMVASLRVAAFEHLLRLPARYVDRRGAGKVLLRFIGDSDALRSWVSRRAPAVRVDRFVLALLVVAMFVIDWRLALVTLLPLPIVWWLARHQAPRLRALTRAARDRQAQLTGSLGARLHFIRQAKWLDRDKRNRRAVRDAAEEVATANIQRDRYGAVLQGAGQFVAFVSVPILLLVGILLAWSDAITFGTCLAFVWLAAHAAVTLHRLNAAVVLWQKAEVSKERILRLLERSAERGRSSHLPKLRAEGRLLRFEDVVVEQQESSITFELHGPGLRALDDSIEVSTVAQAVLGLTKLRQGRVVVDHQSIADVRIDSVRRSVGWIVEHPLILEGTIRQNIHAACPQLDQRLLDERVMSILGGDGTSWLDTATRFSGAELSRDDHLVISILRAVVAEPKFVFVDASRTSDRALKTLAAAIDSLHNSAMVVVSSETAGRLGRCSQRERQVESESRVKAVPG